RFSRDWSSDVCSSDLSTKGVTLISAIGAMRRLLRRPDLGKPFAILGLVQLAGEDRGKLIRESLLIASQAIGVIRQLVVKDNGGKIGRASCGGRGEEVV